MADITMYGADWCGDCIRSKRLLNELGVEFTYVDLEQQPEAQEIVIERNQGAKSIPVIVFPDDSHLTEPSDPQLREKLTELHLI